MKRNLRSRHVPTPWKGTEFNLTYNLYMLPLYAVVYAMRDDIDAEEVSLSHTWPLTAYATLVGKIATNDLRGYRNDYRNYGMLIESFRNTRSRTSVNIHYRSNFVRKSHQRWCNLTAADFWDGDGSVTM